MPRKFQSPQLFQSKIKLGKVVGKGQMTKSSQPVRKATIIDEGHKFRAVRKKNAIIENKVFNPDKGRIVAQYGSTEKGGFARRKLAQSQIAWRKLKRAGLPVPKFFRIQLNKGEDYLASYMSNMRINRGKLIDTHKAGFPRKLKLLKAKRDFALIQSLGRDLGTIYSQGLYCRYLDFWHFFKKKNGQMDRVILDLESFDKQIQNPANLRQTCRTLQANLRAARNFMGAEEFTIFLKELSQSKFYQTNEKLINEVKHDYAMDEA